MTARLDGFGPGRVGISDIGASAGLQGLGLGSGVRVAVVDSGVHSAHPHVGPISDGIGIDPGGRLLPDAVDRLGHGTAVSAAIREKAPLVQIIPVKVFAGELRATVEALEAAIVWASTSGVDVINLSLGTANPAHETRLTEAVRRAVDAGAIVVAAGPDAGTRWLPGSLPGSVAVTLDWALDRHVVVVERNDASGAVSVRASGYPRPIPGVSPERNLKGISFAVANVTGMISRHLSLGVP